jgi:hypothetical protein
MAIKLPISHKRPKFAARKSGIKAVFYEIPVQKLKYSPPKPLKANIILEEFKIMLPLPSQI